jgi:hypothetical protein
MEVDQTVSVHLEVPQEQRHRREGHQSSRSDQAMFRQRRGNKAVDQDP